MKSPSLSLSSLFVLLLMLGFLQRANGWCLKTTFTQSDQATDLDYNNDNTLILSTSKNAAKVYVWDAVTFTLLYTYSVAGRTPQCSKFSKDGNYIAVGLDNGTVNVINGRAPFTSTVVYNFNTGGSTIVEIDFTAPATNKMLVCYGNFFKVYTSFINASFIPAGVGQNPSSASAILGCKFSALEEVGIIDVSRRFSVYHQTTFAKTYEVTLGGGNQFNDFDWRNSASAPQKWIGANQNTSGLLYTLASNSVVASTQTTGAQLNAACYSDDIAYYAYAGNDKKLYIQADNYTNTDIFTDSANNLKSCVFSTNGEYLAVGSVTPSGIIFIYQKNCFDCPIGFWANSITTCASCNVQVSMVGCASCMNDTQCLACFQGYFINSTSHLCLACANVLQGCSTCINNTVCIECNHGYYLTSPSCSTCVSSMAGCLSCNASNYCYACQFDYFIQTNSCTKCSTLITNCVRCNSTANCLQCIMGMYEVLNSGCSLCSGICLACSVSATNCSACVRGYYLSGNTCTSCSSGCLECNSTACLDCKLGTYVNAAACTPCTSPCSTCTTTATTCLSCTVGYYLNVNACLACSNNCSTCSSITNCSSCFLGSYLATPSNVCTICNTKYNRCATCDVTVCFSCEVGYYLNATKLCTPCNNNNQMFACLACNTSTNCQNCAPGFYLTASTGNSSCATCASYCMTCIVSANNCTNCIPGYYLNVNTCASCINNCQTCNSSTYCYSCNAGYYVVAAAGPTSTCVKCSSNITNCIDCLNGSYCLSCGLGYYLQSANTMCGGCVSPCVSCTSNIICQSCELGYYLSVSLTCLKCQQACSQCLTSSNCQACNVGYYFNSTLTPTNQCKTCSILSIGCATCNMTYCYSCQKSYYYNSSNNFCSTCAAITNCLDCTSSTICIYCASGYYLNAGNTSCLNCNTLTGCAMCNSSSNCLTCLSNFYLSLGVCSSCPIKCLTCSSSSLCLSCSQQYIYNSTAVDCILCELYIIGCSICNSTTSCISCDVGYYLMTVSASNIKCDSCRNVIAGCLYCNSSVICTTCQDGYYLNANTCALCNLIPGCSLCNSSAICLMCQNGYYLHTNNLCYICATTMTACLYCNTITTCTTCQSGYYLNSTSTSCTLCQATLTACIFCSNNGNACTACESGYYLNTSTSICNACSQMYCSLCQQNNPTLCVSCNSMFYLNQTTQICQSCTLEGCISCTNNTSCVSCNEGYYLALANHICVLCSTAINGCIKCTRNDSVAVRCLECQSMYYLSSNVCLTCTQSSIGCSYCTTAGICLSCDSGYYLNGSSCSLCSTILGCIMCSNFNTCLFCSSGYYLSPGSSLCISCSSSISNCYDCISSNTCTSCLSGYTINPSNGCDAMKVATSGTPVQNPTDLSFKTYYINTTTLLNVLLVKGMTYNQVSNINWTSSTKIYLENKPSSILLSITSVQWGKNNYTLNFYTNNPLNTTIKSIPMLPSNSRRMLTGPSNSGRMLTGQSYDLSSLQTSLAMTQGVLSQILPNMIYESDLTMSYSLADPQFYSSMLYQTTNSYYFLFGLIITGLLFIMYFIKSICIAPFSNNQGEILPHLFSLKTIPLILFPVYGEYINYAYGFMTADLPWANTIISQFVQSSSSDQSPLGYLLFYYNMNLASMFLLPCVIFLLMLGLGYLALKDNTSSDHNVDEFSEERQVKALAANLQYASYVDYLLNFFAFGLYFAGCSSLQGAILNPTSIIQLNGFFYILGIIVYVVAATEMIYSIFKHQRYFKIRIFCKATLLSLAHLNPVYLVSAVLIIDIVAASGEYYLRRNALECPKIWLTSNILLNVALGLFFYIPDSLIIIYCTSALVITVFVLEIYVCYQESKSFKLRKTSMKIISSNKIANNQTMNFWNTNSQENQEKNKDFIFQESGKVNNEKDESQETKHTGFLSKISGQSKYEPKRRSRKYKNNLNADFETQKTQKQKGETALKIDEINVNEQLDEPYQF